MLILLIFNSKFYSSSVLPNHIQFHIQTNTLNFFPHNVRTQRIFDSSFKQTFNFSYTCHKHWSKKGNSMGKIPFRWIYLKIWQNVDSIIINNFLMGEKSVGLTCGGQNKEPCCCGKEIGRVMALNEEFLTLTLMLFA